MSLSYFASATDADIANFAASSKAWPFEEAKKLLKRYEKIGFPEIVLFETGYGPSGLPHIGTFGEVARTTMVRNAFCRLTEGKVKTKLLCFSDDMDGLRKVPENVPHREEMAHFLEMPLTSVPDPFNEGYASFGEANNARLCKFLDSFNFSYEFASATDYYKSGKFDQTLLKMLEAYEQVMAIILPTLGAERRATYSPFLPISQVSGKVLQVPILSRHLPTGTITYIEPDTGKEVETKVTGGRVKCQWKADWALRWSALQIAYEMSGKDLIDSVRLSSRICRVLGASPPEGFNYELFLDEKGQKISKSTGNGLTIEEWLRYAPADSLSFYMYQKPKTAKKLYFDVIPRAVDEFYAHLASYPPQTLLEALNNPLWHVYNGEAKNTKLPVSFSMLLNLVSASNAQDKEALWGYISRYAPGTTPQTHPELDALTGFAVRYFIDLVKPYKKFRAPDNVEKRILEEIAQKLASLNPQEQKEAVVIQQALLDIARQETRYQDSEKLQADGRYGVSVGFFQMLYQLLLGQEQGPRFGSFVALYGVDKTKQLIQAALERGE